MPGPADAYVHKIPPWLPQGPEQILSVPATPWASLAGVGLGAGWAGSLLGEQVVVVEVGGRGGLP